MAIASPGFKASETGFAICPGGGLKIIPSVIPRMTDGRSNGTQPKSSINLVA